MATGVESDILDDLYHALDRDPDSVYLHERLLEIWAELGDKDMTSGFAKTLQQLDPGNELAAHHLGLKAKAKSSSKPKPSKKKTLEPSQQRNFSNLPGSSSSQGGPSNFQPLTSLTAQEKDLKSGYNTLKFEAQMLRIELAALLPHLSATTTDPELLPNLQAISEGKVSTVIPMESPLSVRERAREINANPDTAPELIIEDFESVVRWAALQDPPLDTDAIRSRLIKRKTLLEAAIPEKLAKETTAAMRHIEREYLEKTYVNTETMLGDDVSDIPKENFFVSEDNYAWDMSELAMAISANAGVMRNPLSKQLFTPTDIRTILSHPLGASLAPLQLAQSQLKKGIRPATIEFVARVGKIMLEDQSVDQGPSREVLDEWVAYEATLPEGERRTIRELKIPGVDSGSRQHFDYSIGESVGDAVANVTCLHKVGDFLSQAARWLGSQ